MRRPLIYPLAFAAVGVLAGCAHPPPSAVLPRSPITTGAPTDFASGDVAVSKTRVTLHLTAPAYVAVVRVFPGQVAELAYAGRSRLLPGTRRVALIVDRARVWQPGIPRLTLGSSTSDEGSPECLMLQARYTMEHANTPQGTSPPPPPRCTPRRNPRQPDPDAGRSGHWVAGAPFPLGEHYVVVIAADAPFDAAQAAELLGELDISLVSGEEAARVLPGYLLGEGSRWGAWIVHLD